VTALGLELELDAPAAVAAPRRLTMTSGGTFLVLLAAATAIPWLGLPLMAGQTGVGAQSKTALLFLGSGFHVAASYAVYLHRDLRPLLRAGRVRYFVVPVLLVAGGAVFMMATSGAVTATAVVAYFIWQTHHYTKQNIGVFAFATRARRTLGPSLLERSAITTAGFAGVIGMITIITPYQSTPFASAAMYAHNVAVLVFLAAGGLLFACVPRALLAGDPVRFAFLIGGVLFYLPTFVYRDPFPAVASYAIAHGCQYLVFMGYVAGAERRLRMLAATGAVALVGGLALWHTGSLHGTVGRLASGAALGVVMAHFVIDAGVWRLSEPFQREFMSTRFRFLRPTP
jgi:hypothetical protein